jgi:hypothetical protein
MRLFLMPELMWYKSSVLKPLKGNCFDDLTAVIFAANYLPKAFKLKRFCLRYLTNMFVKVA